MMQARLLSRAVVLVVTGIYYGGHHAVHPLRLEQVSQPVVLDARPTPDEPKFQAMTQPVLRAV